MGVYAIIPARGGSRRIPRKNMQRIGTLTLTQIAVECAFVSKIFDRVILTTDDDVIRTSVMAFPCTIIGRPPALASDSAQMAPVIDHVYKTANLHRDDIYVLLQPTSPFRSPGDIQAVVSMARERGSAKTVTASRLDPDCHQGDFNGVAMAQVFASPAQPYQMHPLPMTERLRTIDIDWPDELYKARALFEYAKKHGNEFNIWHPGL